MMKLFFLSYFAQFYFVISSHVTIDDVAEYNREKVIDLIINFLQMNLY